MTRRPWDADRELDDALAAALVRRLFPELDADALVWVGAGWDYDVYRAGAWAVRFPRRAEYGRRSWEGPLLRLLQPALASFGVELPVPLREGAAPQLFPYPVTAHRWVPGQDAARLPREAALAMLPTLGRCLRAVHDTPAEAVAPMGLPDEDWLMHQRLDETQGDLPELRELVSAEADPELHRRMDWAEGLTRADVPPEPEGPQPLLHSDLATEHVLVDVPGGRLRGIIDWSDAAFGDPANDFVGIAAAWGHAGLAAALEGYGSHDPRLVERVTFMARVATLHWLHDALLRGEDGAKQRRWIDQAFALPHTPNQDP